MREEFFFFFSYESLGRLVSVYVQIRVIYEKHLRESMLFSSSFRENIFYPLEVKHGQILLVAFSFSRFRIRRDGTSICRFRKPGNTQ